MILTPARSHRGLPSSYRKVPNDLGQRAGSQMIGAERERMILSRVGTATS